MQIALQSRVSLSLFQKICGNLPVHAFVQKRVDTCRMKYCKILYVVEFLAMFLNKVKLDRYIYIYRLIRMRILIR